MIATDSMARIFAGSVLAFWSTTPRAVRHGAVLAVALALLTATPVRADEIDLDTPEGRMFIQYAETVGRITACGDLGRNDKTEEIAMKLAERSIPGFWAWASGAQGDYVDTLLAASSRAKMIVMSESCQIAPLQDGYRQILESIELSLLNLRP